VRRIRESSFFYSFRLTILNFAIRDVDTFLPYAVPLPPADGNSLLAPLRAHSHLNPLSVFTYPDGSLPSSLFGFLCSPENVFPFFPYFIPLPLPASLGCSFSLVVVISGSFVGNSLTVSAASVFWRSSKHLFFFGRLYRPIRPGEFHAVFHVWTACDWARKSFGWPALA